MEFALSEEQEMLKSMARDFLTEKFTKKLVQELEADERGYTPYLWQEMVELGWTGLAFPEKYGGTGMCFQDLAVLLEEMGRASVTGPFFSTVILGALPIFSAGTEDQKEEYLALITRGEGLFTLAVAEEEGLYEAASIKTWAMANGSDYVISGRKFFVPDAHISDYLLCAVRTNGAANPEKGISVFIIDTKTPGITTTLLKTLSGEKLCEVVLDNVRVSGDNILGELNGGWEIVEAAVQTAAVAKCCEMVGAMQWVLEMTVNYAKERKQFGVPIGSFQVLQHYCAEMATIVDGSRYITYQAAWLISEGDPCRQEIAMAKAWVSDHSEQLVMLAHQIHGAIGFTMDHDLQFYTRRIKSAQSLYGDADHYHEVLAKEMAL